MEIDTNNDVDGASGTAYQRGGVSTVQGSFALNLSGVGSRNPVRVRAGYYRASSDSSTTAHDDRNAGYQQRRTIPGPAGAFHQHSECACHRTVAGPTQVNATSGSGVTAKFSLVYYQMDSNTQLLVDVDLNRVANGILIRQY